MATTPTAQIRSGSGAGTDDGAVVSSPLVPVGDSSGAVPVIAAVDCGNGAIVDPVHAATPQSQPPSSTCDAGRVAVTPVLSGAPATVAYTPPVYGTPLLFTPPSPLPPRLPPLPVTTTSTPPPRLPTTTSMSRGSSPQRGGVECGLCHCEMDSRHGATAEQILALYPLFRVCRSEFATLDSLRCPVDDATHRQLLPRSQEEQGHQGQPQQQQRYQRQDLSSATDAHPLITFPVATSGGASGRGDGCTADQSAAASAAVGNDGSRGAVEHAVTSSPSTRPHWFCRAGFCKRFYVRESDVGVGVHCCWDAAAVGRVFDGVVSTGPSRFAGAGLSPTGHQSADCHVCVQCVGVIGEILRHLHAYVGHCRAWGCLRVFAGARFPVGCDSCGEGCRSRPFSCSLCGAWSGEL